VDLVLDLIGQDPQKKGEAVCASETAFQPPPPFYLRKRPPSDRPFDRLPLFTCGFVFPSILTASELVCQAIPGYAVYVGVKSMIIVTVCSYPQPVDNFGDSLRTVFGQ